MPQDRQDLIAGTATSLKYIAMALWAMADTGGQVWYANHQTGVVIVQMATNDTPSASTPSQVSSARTELLKNIDEYISQ